MIFSTRSGGCASTKRKSLKFFEFVVVNSKLVGMYPDSLSKGKEKDQYHVRTVKWSEFYPLLTKDSWSFYLLEIVLMGV